MSENQKHKLLKEQAKNILLKGGFKLNEIFFEYQLKIKND